jgi:hypothetical protein
MLGTELGNKDIEIAWREAQIVQLGVALYQLQEHVQLWLRTPKQPEEDPEEIDNGSSVDEDWVASWFGRFLDSKCPASSSHLVSCDGCIHEDFVPVCEPWM